MKPVRSEIPPLTYGTFYHIYNRGNNRENIFIQERNYAYFMELWWKHISPIAETWAYGLLRNHFHASVFIKENPNLTPNLNPDLTPNLTGLTSNLVNHDTRVDKSINPLDSRGDLSGFKDTNPLDSRQDLTGLKNKKIKDPSQYFSNFFNAYARGLNLSVQRTGALFERPFKRIPVDSESYLMRLIVYIHQNPQKHKFVNDFRDWNYTSYHELISNVPTRLPRDRVMQLFGSQKDFIRIHQEIQPLEGYEDED